MLLAMKKKVLSIVMVLAMIAGLTIPALAGNGNGTNGNVSNIFLTGRVDYKDYNNANFHCNAINGNGRVWTTLGKDYTQQMNDILTFERTDLRAPQSVAGKDTTWLLINRATQEPVMSANGKKIEGWIVTDPSAEMFICEQCGSQLWISYSNNSGEPDGKNIQITHPGKEIEIIKVWLDAEGNAIKGTGLSAKFTITWTGKDGVERSMNNVGPGKYSFPEDLIDSIVVTETGAAKNYTLIEIDGKNVIGVISGQLNDDGAITFTNKEDPYAIIHKEWDIEGVITKGGKVTIGGGEDAVTIEALFDVFGYDEDEDGLPVRGGLVAGNVKADKIVYVAPGKYIVGEQPKPGFDAQPDQVIEVKEYEAGTCTFVNTPTTGEDGGLSFEKKVEGIGVIEWLDGKGYNDGEIDAILSGLEFYLTNDDTGDVEGPADCSYGVYSFFNIPVGTYTLSEEITGAAVGIFKKMADIGGIYIGPGSNNFFVLGGTIKGNIEGVDLKPADFFTIVNGYGTGNTLGYPGLNNNGDLFYIGVTNTRTNVEFASFCAYPGAHWFAGNGEGAGTGYMVARSIEDLKYQQAFNFIVDNYYNDGDFFLYNSEARRIAQTVVWALLGAIEVASEAWDNVNLSEAEKAAVLDTLAAVEAGYVGSGTVIDVVYMLGVDADYNTLDEEHWINAQPQIVPIFGVFYVENEPEGGGEDFSIMFTKTKYGGLLEVFADEFSFDLYEIAGEEEVFIENYPTGFGGVVFAENLLPGSYVFKELVSIVSNTGHAIDNYGYKHTWTVAEVGFTINADGSIVWGGDVDEDGNYVIDNEIMCKNGLQLAADGEFGSWANCGAYEWVLIPATCTRPAEIQAWCNCGEHGHYDPNATEGFAGLFIGEALGHTFLDDDAEVYVWALDAVITIGELRNHPNGLHWFGLDGFVGVCETCGEFVCE